MGHHRTCRSEEFRRKTDKNKNWELFLLFWIYKRIWGGRGGFYKKKNIWNQ